MTLRIETNRDGRRVTFRLIGRLRGEDLSDLERLTASAGGPVVLDLDEVNLVDVDAVHFLRDAERTGIELRNCPPFVRAWIDRERVGGS